MVLAQVAEQGRDPLLLALLCVLMGVAVILVVYFWTGPIVQAIRRREATYDNVMRGTLLMTVEARTVTILTFIGILALAALGFAIFQRGIAAFAFGAMGVFLPSLVLKYLKYRRAYKLDDQIVDGIQTLSSGVRAGLNLIQAMELLGQSGVRPISDEFAHLLREYQHGMSIERAMQNTVSRIASANYRLLFSALLTHRERGGDLGETLDRISDSIREIHRLEKKIETLTAPGRAAARAMGAMPAVILVILYFLFPADVKMLWTEDLGKLLLALILLFNVVGFLWIRRIVNIDI